MRYRMRVTLLDVPVLHGFPKRRRVRDSSGTPSDEPHHTIFWAGHISCHDVEKRLVYKDRWVGG
jgi:hypothetical protein